MLLSYVKPSRPHKAYAYTVPLATKQGDNKHEGKRCRNTPPEGDIFPRLLVPRRRHLRLSHTAPVAESCRTGESPQKPRPAGAPPAGSTQRQPRAHHWNVGIFTPAVATPTSTLSERRLQWGLTSGVAFITRPSGKSEALQDQDGRGCQSVPPADRAPAGRGPKRLSQTSCQTPHWWRWHSAEAG